MDERGTGKTKPHEVGVGELRKRLTEVLNAANLGVETVVTKHGHPHAKIGPPPQKEARSDEPPRPLPLP